MAGLLLNFLALIPAVVIMMFVLGVFGLGTSAAVALKSQRASETESSAHDSQTIKHDESIDKANATNPLVQDGERKKGTQSASENPAALKNKPVPTENFGDYYVETKLSGKLMILQITFRKLPPSTDTASKIVRSEMEKAVAKDGSREVLAMAFNEDGDALPDRYYGGALTYKPSDGSI